MAAQTDASTLAIAHRPKEGDLIYFPLGRRLFEIKFVEHEQPFYQLGKGYTYELQCELFEYEDRLLNTSIDEIDSSIQNKGIYYYSQSNPTQQQKLCKSKCWYWLYQGVDCSKRWL